MAGSSTHGRRRSGTLRPRSASLGYGHAAGGQTRVEGESCDDGSWARRCAVGVSVVGGAVAGVASAGSIDSAIPDETAVGGSWTVLHYSMSDNNLEPYMMLDVNEMGE